MSEKQEFLPKITYLAKDETICPVCENKFKRELLMSGGGRLDAQDVTENLHRNYRPSKKFGIIHPLIYFFIVCPNCFYCCLAQDFADFPEENKNKFLNNTSERVKFANKIIGKPVDYTSFKTLESGAAGLALCVNSYDYFPKKASPTIKQAICSVRTAYLFEELEKVNPNQNYGYISKLYYKKALFFYKRAIELNQKKAEILENVAFLGPDIDKNYGYDSILYLIGVLTYKYGDKNDPEQRKKDLEEARLYLGKLFGLGKADFDKPKEILDKSKDFHKLINEELKSFDEK
jgi:uncharacterized protein